MSDPADARIHQSVRFVSTTRFGTAILGRCVEDSRNKLFVGVNYCWWMISYHSTACGSVRGASFYASIGSPSYLSLELDLQPIHTHISYNYSGLQVWARNASAAVAFRCPSSGGSSTNGVCQIRCPVPGSRRPRQFDKRKKAETVSG